MVAMVGILVQSFGHFPGFPPFPVTNPARPLDVFERLCAAEGKAVALALVCIGVVDVTIGRQASTTHFFDKDGGGGYLRRQSDVA